MSEQAFPWLDRIGVGKKPKQQANPSRLGIGVTRNASPI